MHVGTSVYTPKIRDGQKPLSPLPSNLPKELVETLAENKQSA